MTKAEELAIKDNLTEDDLSYIMTMDHVEYKEYSLVKSSEKGLIKHFKDMDQYKQPKNNE